jgi:hypothetical protein
MNISLEPLNNKGFIGFPGNPASEKIYETTGGHSKKSIQFAMLRTKNAFSVLS